MESRNGCDGVEEGGMVIFVYGTLKRGYGNHWLMEEMLRDGHAQFIGVGRTKEKYPLLCGPYQVPFLLGFQGRGHHVWGELYAVDEEGVRMMDDLEGTAKGHYTRQPLFLHKLPSPSPPSDEEEVVMGQAYFAAKSYASQLWMKSGHMCLTTYSQEETKTYVKRKDRPQHLTFLQHINLFISSSSPPSVCDQVQHQHPPPPIATDHC